MTDKKPERSGLRFEKEAKALQNNLAKRRKQQEELEKKKNKSSKTEN
jgi:hypothetical protein